MAFDMIGYGFSAKPAGFDYTTFNQVDILQSLLENLNIKKVHILAHDYGNTITQELLARAEENRLNFTIETHLFYERRAVSRNASSDFGAENFDQSDWFSVRQIDSRCEIQTKSGFDFRQKYAADSKRIERILSKFLNSTADEKSRTNSFVI